MSTLATITTANSLIPPFGALTTVFTPPPTCTPGPSSSGFESCYPTGWWSHLDPAPTPLRYYSPGICPLGFTSACSPQSSLLLANPILPSETAAVCCHSGFTCDPASPYFCASTVSAAPETTSYWAVVLVRWQSSDLSILETDPTRPSTPTTISPTSSSGSRTSSRTASSSATSSRTPGANGTEPTDPNNNGSGSGLSTAAKIAIGVVVPVVAIAAALAIFFFCCLRRREPESAEMTPVEPMTHVQPVPAPAPRELDYELPDAGERGMYSSGPSTASVPLRGPAPARVPMENPDLAPASGTYRLPPARVG